MDFKRLDIYYEEFKKGLLEAEEAVKKNIDSEKQATEEVKAKLESNEIVKMMELECNHQKISDEMMFLIAELITMSIGNIASKIITENDTK